MIARVSFRVWTIAFVVVILVLLPFSGLPVFYVQQAFLIFFFAALAQSWNILGGYAGYLSLGHAAFVGIGGYTVGILSAKMGWSLFWTFPLAAIFSAILALCIGAVCFRIRGSYFLIATMLVLFILQSLALNLKQWTNGSAGIDIALFTDDYIFEARLWYFGALLLVGLSTAIAALIQASRFGLNLMAIREDEDVARTMGVRATSTKAIAFMISASLTGLLGASYTYHAHIIEPFSAFSLDLSAAPILMAILGGTRTWVGPLVGATLYQAISTALAVSFGNEYTNLMFSAFLIIVVLLLPNGIVGLAKRKTKLDAASDPGVKMQLKPSELDR